MGSRDEYDAVTSGKEVRRSTGTGQPTIPDQQRWWKRAFRRVRERLVDDLREHRLGSVKALTITLAQALRNVLYSCADAIPLIARVLEDGHLSDDERELVRPHLVKINELLTKWLREDEAQRNNVVSIGGAR